MKKVFLGGSRKISKLSDEVRRRIDKIVEQGLPILVGDASGVDKSVQAYLLSKAYPHVEVYCAESRCRNNLGAWPVRKIAANGTRRDRKFYATKDRAMADDSSYGLMIWDGDSLGTIMNVFRMCALRKPTVVYMAGKQQFMEVRDLPDLQDLLQTVDASLRDRLNQAIAEESAQLKGREPSVGLSL
jgi:hypothetical protein